VELELPKPDKSVWQIKNSGFVNELIKKPIQYIVTPSFSQGNKALENYLYK
jgi:hypothetical protein